MHLTHVEGTSVTVYNEKWGWKEYLDQLFVLSGPTVNITVFDSAIRRRLLVSGKKNAPESTTQSWRAELWQLVATNKLDWMTGQSNDDQAT